MKILSFILKLVGGLCIAYGVCTLLVYFLMWGGEGSGGSVIAIAVLFLIGGIILNLVGNFLYKNDGAKVSSFKLTK